MNATSHLLDAAVPVKAGADLGAAGTPEAAAESFFSSYEWCLNPLQTFAALCARAQEELARRDSLEIRWQREETRTNLYLLLCAACCTIDDYLAHRPCDLSPAVRRLPRLGACIRLVQGALNAAPAVRRSLGDGHARRLRKQLAHCVDLVCEILVDRGQGHPLTWTSLAAAMREVSCVGLPSELLAWRARIPEAFRCQDMTHFDALAMAQRFLRAEANDARPVLVVGLRTAGAYFAPLVKAVLAERAFPVVGWMTIRPKLGMSRQERREFRRAMAAASRVLVVDDHPNTGATFAKTLELFGGMGIASERVVILAPDHPAQLDWTRRAGDAKRVILPFGELYKQQLLQDDAAIAGILGDLYGRHGWTDVSLRTSLQLDRLNGELAARLVDTFEVRLKRVWQVQLRRGGGPAVERFVVAKSVGWGWLGYHAVLASLRLAEFVPPLVGFRHGLMFCEWVGPIDGSARRPTAAQIAPLVATYVAARVKRLRLDDDPSFARLGTRQAGLDMLLRTLRHPCGRMLGPLFAARLRARMGQYRASRPALIDGRMEPAEWVLSESGIVKVDFEQHNFGGAQLDVVDGCYDLACAIRDLDIAEPDEAAIVAQYSRQSGDSGAAERLALYKVLSGVAAMRAAAHCAVRGTSREAQEGWNRRYNRARDVLNFQMARHCASFAEPRATPPTWSSRLFFLDLDGVFDAEYFGPLFQHTTPTGIEALSLLREGGFSVVLNTGRSIEHVKRYCATYALPGGVAEYGSVFFDAVAGVELPLVEQQTLRQLDHCRARLERMPGVFVDPGYRWSLRAYRYRGDVTIGLEADELAALLTRHGLDRLGFIARDVDSHIGQKGVDKGSAASFVKRHLPHHERPIIAIGDSAQDLCMFEQADIAYVPANFDRACRHSVQGAKYRALRMPRQAGLLEAARDLTRKTAAGRRRNATRAEDGHILDWLLTVAEQPRRRRLLAMLRLPDEMSGSTRRGALGA